MKQLNQFVDAMFGPLDRTGVAWARIGIICLIVAAAMSFDYGAQVSLKHGAFLACLSFAAAFGPEVAYKVWEEGKKIVAGVLGIAAVGLLIVEFGSHHNYTAGIRGHEQTTARVANVRFDSAQDAAKDDAANVALWRKQLTDLQAQNAWAATVKADALRSELAALKDRMEKEEKGLRGKPKGKGKEFEALQDKANALEQRIATVEQAEGLSKRIEATQRILDTKREKAAATEHKSSAVAHANNALAKAFAFVSFGDTTPSEKITAGADTAANVAMAAVGTCLPAFCLFVAGLYRRKESSLIEHDIYSAPASSAQPTYVQPREIIAQQPKPTPAPSVKTVIQRIDGMVQSRNPETLGITHRKVLAA